MCTIKIWPGPREKLMSDKAYLINLLWVVDIITSLFYPLLIN